MRATRRTSSLLPLLACLTFLVFPVTAFGQHWGKVFDGRYDESAAAVLEDRSGDFVVAGRTRSFGAGGEDLLFAGLDGAGNVVLQKVYGGASDDYATGLVSMSSGGFLVSGVTHSFGAGGGDIWALKLNSLGEPEWQKSFGGGGLDLAATVLETTHLAMTGLLLAGTVDAGASGDVLLVALDGSGAIRWQRRYDSGQPQDDLLSAAIQTDDDGDGRADDGYLVGGRAMSRNGDFWILKLDAFGGVVWSRAYGLNTGVPPDALNEFYEGPPLVTQAADGGFLVAGVSTPPVVGSPFACVMKLDVLGDVEWIRDYGNALTVKSLRRIGGDYLLAGTGGVQSPGGNAGASWLLRLDEGGTVLWSSRYGNPTWAADGTFDVLSDARPTADGGIIAAGRSEFSGTGSGDIWMLRLDDRGEILHCPLVQSGGRVGALLTAPGPVMMNMPVTETTPSVTITDTSVVPENASLMTRSGCRIDPEVALISLPRTGRTTSLHAGDDGVLQAGVPWPSPRFNDNGDGTITDELTGLMWLKDADCAASSGYTAGGRLTWDGMFSFIDAINDGSQNISACSAYSAPYTDWRAPNVVELEGLLNLEFGDQGPWLEGQGFANVRSVFVSPDAYPVYHTSTTVEGGVGTTERDVWMDTGTVYSHGSAPFKTTPRYVWPVRGGPDLWPDPVFPADPWRTGQMNSYDDDPVTGPVEARDDGGLQRGVYWPLHRFTDRGDGTVLDNLTGLMWLRDAECFGQFNWTDALDTVADFNTTPTNYDCAAYDETNAPYDDWTLPNRKQLFSLIDADGFRPALPGGHPFLRASDWSTSHYWTSSVYEPSSLNAWTVGFERGTMDHVPQLTASREIWPVRIYDGDRDGLSDAWEREHFGNLSATDGSADSDGDGLSDREEHAIGTDPTRRDSDSDFCDDGVDPAPLAPGNDDDSDFVGSDCDNCPSDANPTQDDTDGDGSGDACDPCPALFGHGGDADGDGLGMLCDNCPRIRNGDPASAATCDPNADGTLDAAEIPLCDQADTDGDGIGDACDFCEAATLPDRFDLRDWRGINWMTPVKDQCRCGSCWAFATVGAVEARYNLEHGSPFEILDLAEQPLVSSCFFWGSCSGGLPWYALEHIRDQGLPDETCDPYDPTSLVCSPCAGWTSRAWQIDGYRSISSDNVETIKREIACNGPLITCGGPDGDLVHWHCVAIVGWQEPAGNWIVKSSWGTGPGNSGYYAIPYGHDWTRIDWLDKWQPFGVHRR